MSKSLIDSGYALRQKGIKKITFVMEERELLTQKVKAKVEAMNLNDISLVVSAEHIGLYNLLSDLIVSLDVAEGGNLTRADMKVLESMGLKDVAKLPGLKPVIANKNLLNDKQEAFNTLGFQA